MNRSSLSLLLASFSLALAACATNAPDAPVLNAPVTPSDLEVTGGPWALRHNHSCMKKDGVLVEMKSYTKKEAQPTLIRALSRITMNKVLVYQAEGLRDLRSADPPLIISRVKNSDGTWSQFEYLKEPEKTNAAIDKIVGMTGPEFHKCAGE